MSLQVTMAITIEGMDGSMIIKSLHTDTVVAPDPENPISEVELASASLGRLGSDLISEAKQRLTDIHTNLTKQAENGSLGQAQ